MKGLILFLIIVLVTSLFPMSCNNEIPASNWKPIYIVNNYKGCEYLMDGYRLSHSGTCPNPIHPENWTKEMWQEKLGLDNK